MSKQEEIKQLLNDHAKFTERMESTNSYNLADSSVTRLQSIEERIVVLVPELLEEVEKWKKLADAKVIFASNGNDDYQYELQEENMRLQKELEEARKVLRFYADTKNYEQEKVLYDNNDPLDCYYEAPEVQNDQGERARAFLVGQEGEGNQ